MPIMPRRHCPLHRDCHGQHGRERRQRFDQTRDQSYRAVYKTPQWRAFRAAHLAQQPLCERCRRDGVLRAKGERGTTSREKNLRIDHIQPHRGDMTIFWARAIVHGEPERGNAQTLCPEHDDSKRAKENGIAPCPGHGAWVAQVLNVVVCRDCGRPA